MISTSPLYLVTIATTKGGAHLDDGGHQLEVIRHRVEQRLRRTPATKVMMVLTALTVFITVIRY